MEIWRLETDFSLKEPPEKQALSVCFGISASIPIGREIQCLQYAGFLLSALPLESVCGRS